jgi:hypothetical protein
MRNEKESGRSLAPLFHTKIPDPCDLAFTFLKIGRQ